ncbi:MAG: hypothetical protein RBR64_03300 [Bacteroidales bacterium]|jgi:hypothetical protein|nr:hypothetical protein [Bacteroidales bacterium]
MKNITIPISSFLLLLTISFVLFTGCGQTDTDIEHEAMLIGSWYPVDTDGDTLESYNVPQYHFKKNNEGFSQGNSSAEDEFKWEVRRGQIKIYYDKAPEYYIGYDKYNSQSLMRIKEITENWFEVSQFYSDGFQSDLKFNRIIEE